MRLRWDTDEGAAVEKEVLKLVVVVIVVAVLVVVSVVGLKVFYTSIPGWQRSSAGL